MKRKSLSRREFLALTSLGVTGAYVGLQTGAARAMMGGGGMGAAWGAGPRSSTPRPVRC